MRARLLLHAFLVLCALALGLPHAALAADRDHDGIADEADSCPLENGHGVSNGCPATKVSYVWRGSFDHQRFRFGSLLISTQYHSKVEVACSASTTCPRRKVVRAFRSKRELKQFKGLLAPTGMIVEIRASRNGHIGDYVRFRMN